VANSNPGANSDILPGTVSVISDETNTVVSTITVDPLPGKMVYDSGKGEIFFIAGGSSISVISDTNNTVVADLTPPIGPVDLAYDSAKGAIFICGYYFGFDADNRTICVLSDDTNVFVATLSLSGVRATATGVAYDPALGEVLVSVSDGNVYVLSGTSLPNATLSPSPTALASSNPSPSPTATVSSSPSVITQTSTPTPLVTPSPTPEPTLLIPNPFPTPPNSDNPSEYEAIVLFGLIIAIIAAAVVFICSVRRRKQQTLILK